MTDNDNFDIDGFDTIVNATASDKILAKVHERLHSTVPSGAGDCCLDCKTDIEHGRAKLAKKGKAFDFSIEFTLTGKAGETLTLIQCPLKNMQPVAKMFRGEKFIVVESVEDATRISCFTIGGTSQIPTWTLPSASKLWVPTSLDCGIRFDTIEHETAVVIQVEFLKDADWSAVIFGRAVK